MNPSRVRGLILAALFAAPAGAQAQGASDSGSDAGPEGGTASCVSSGDCALPTPYCDEANHACVECLSDQNCADSTGLCNLAERVCVPCLNDLDCGVPAPYCSTELDRCVECKTDANCGEPGIVCIEGNCGSCGDGFCAQRERLLVDFSGPGADDPNGPIVCTEDCEALCPGIDLGSALGRNLITVETTGLRNLFATACGGSAGPDLTVTWTAPVSGGYLFDSSGSSLPVVMGYSEQGCASMNFGCSSGGDAWPFDVRSGETLTVVLDTDSEGPGTFVLSIERYDEGQGGPIDPPDLDAGPAPSSAECVSNAAARGDSRCAGVECACAACPEDYDDCGVVPGCRDVLACMQEHDCVGAECYNSGACRAVTDSFGGVSGPAFRAASNLFSCVQAFDCAWPCSVDAGAPAGARDAGQLCEPGRVVSCECDGGTSGRRRCNDDGEDFGVCECGVAADAAVEDEDDGEGCGCRVGRRAVRETTWIAGALLGLSVLRRVRRRNVG